MRLALHSTLHRALCTVHFVFGNDTSTRSGPDYQKLNIDWPISQAL